MQWLIDIIFALCKTYIDSLFADYNSIPSGSIVAWSGLAINIPTGWVRCDGDNDTPDLRTRFIIASGTGYPSHSTGGSETHNHTADTTHNHSMNPGNDIATGLDYENVTDSPKKGGVTGTSSSLSPYYCLVYIMKT